MVLEGSRSNVAIQLAIIKNPQAFTGKFKLKSGRYEVICNVFIKFNSSVKDLALNQLINIFYNIKLNDSIEPTTA